MIAPSLPTAAGAGAGAATTPAHDAAIGAEAGSGSGFADLMSPAAKADAIADSAAGSAAELAESATEPESTVGDTDAEPGLPERLLALIGASATAPAVPGGGPPPSLAPERPLPMPEPAPRHAVLLPTVGAAPLPSVALDKAAAATPATPAATAPLADALFTDTAMPANATVAPGPQDSPAPLPTLTTPVPAATHSTTPAAAGLPAPMDHAAAAAALGEIAKALAPAGTEADASRDAGNAGDSTEVTGIGERGPLLATSTPATTRTAAPVAAAQMLAMPADPSAGFDDSFGARIGWLAEQGIGRAELRINPEHLGTVEVRLQMDGTRVSAEFQSPHADVRHALEQSVGRLREMLGQHGLQLAHADVGQGRGDGQRAPAASPAVGTDVESDRVEMPSAPALRSRGLLDEYA